MKNVSAFRAILAVTCASTGEYQHTYSDLMNVASDQVQVVDRDKYLFNMHAVMSGQYTDLLIIDIDSFGIDDACYLVFVASVFAPKVPVVLVTRNVLPDTHRSRYLRSAAGVLDIIELADHGLALTAA